MDAVLTTWSFNFLTRLLKLNTPVQVAFWSKHKKWLSEIELCHPILVVWWKQLKVPLCGWPFFSNRQAQVGYGDFAPKHWGSRLTLVFFVMASLILVATSIGEQLGQKPMWFTKGGCLRVFGHRENVAPKKWIAQRGPIDGWNPFNQLMLVVYLIICGV